MHLQSRSDLLSLQASGFVNLRVTPLTFGQHMPVRRVPCIGGNWAWWGRKSYCHKPMDCRQHVALLGLARVYPVFRAVVRKADRLWKHYLSAKSLK